MFLSQSTFSSKTTIIISCFLLLFQSLLADSVSYPHSNEKLFRSTVTVKAAGNALVANDKKSNLERLFKDSYTNLLQSICSFRSLEDVSLIDIIEEDDSVFDLHFVLIVKCYDCSNKTHLFRDDTITGRKLKAENTCLWNNHNADAVGDDLFVNVAPFKDDFAKEYIKLISEKNIDSVKALLTINENSAKKTSEEPIPCPCSQKSFCAYTNNYMKDFHRISKGLYHNCTCRDGFAGNDGWRCESINECDDEDNWPCAPKEEGGYCIDTDPDDQDTPMYKCGCIPPNFVENTNHTIGVHGAKHCLKVVSDEVVEDEVNADAEDRNNDSSEIYDIQFSFTCENENTFPGITSIEVTGDPDAILFDIEKLERSVQFAYEKALPSQCAFRSLENITILGLLLEDGREVSLSSSNRSLSNRFLQGEETDNVYGVDFNGMDLTTNETDSNTTDGLLTFDDDDGAELSLNLDFNFSIFFSMIMRCFGCPRDAQLFDDASRRGLRGRSLQDEGSCTCQLDNGTVVEDSAVNQVVAPSINDFVVEFRKTIIEEKVVSVAETITVEDETGNADEIPFEPIFEQPISIIRDELPSDRISCPRECNPNNQQCDTDTLKCVCKEGYFQPGGAGAKCFDEDECRSNSSNECDRNAECANVEGGYECACKSGFTGDGFFCDDIDECISVDACTGNGEICVNIAGSFRCVTAQPTLKPTPVPAPRIIPTTYPTDAPTTTPPTPQPVSLPFTQTQAPSSKTTPCPTPKPTTVG